MRRSLALLPPLLAAGCGASPKPPPADLDVDPPPGAATELDAGPPAPALPAVPARFAEADLVAFEGRDLAFYALGPDAITALGRMPLADPDEGAILAGDWLDRDTLVVAHGRYGTPPHLVAITAAGARPLAVPDPALLTVDRAASADPALEEGVGGEDTLDVTDGAAWWSACAWGLPYDGGQCERYVHVRLLPTPGRRVDTDRIDARTWPWPDARPAGFTLVEGQETDHLLCTSPAVGTRRSKPVVLAGASDDEHIASHRWVSADPPRLLVVWGTFGLDDLVPSRWALHDGCTAAPIAAGESVAPGPPPLWVAQQLDPDDTADERPPQAIIYRGAVSLGALDPKATTVRFRR